MRKLITVTALAVACSALVIATPYAQTKPAAHSSTAKVATHSTSGTVKSIDASTLVISKGSKKGSDMTFTVNGSTQKDANVAVGSHVTVRYQTEGKTMVATAITEQPAASHQTASAKTTSKPATKK